MQKPLPVLVSLLLLHAPLIAQTTEGPLTPPAPFSAHDRLLLPVQRAQAASRVNTTQRLHNRTSSYTWARATSQWSTQVLVTTHTRDTQGNLLTETVTDSVAQQPKIRRSYVRNATGGVTSFLQEDWNGTAWQATTRYTNTLDSQDRIIEQISQQFSTGTWTNSSRYIQTFNSQGNVTSFLRQQWQNGSWVAQSGSQTQFIYDALNRLLDYTYSSFNINSGTFLPISHVICTYVGTTPLMSTMVEQYWQNGAWANGTKTSNFTYDAQDRPLSSHSEEWSGSTWVLQRRSTFTYSPTSRSTEVQETRQGTGWVNYQRITQDYDRQGYSLGSIWEIWTNNAWQLSSGSMRSVSYNATNDLVASFTKVVFGNSFVNSSRIYYSNFQSYVLPTRPAAATARTWQLYPNPTNGRVTLQASGSAARPQRAEVLNNLGQVVWLHSFAPAASAGSLPLDLGPLPAGLYTLRLHTASGTETHRLIKE